MKDRLIPKMLALVTAATLTTATLTGCQVVANQKNLVLNLSDDANVEINQCVFIIPQKLNDNYYISLIAHYDTGDKYSISFHSRPIGFEDHKDYRITYLVNEEDYLKVDEVIPNSYKAKMLSQEELVLIEQIVEKYDPIEVKDLAVDEDGLHDDIDEIFFLN